MTPDQSGAGNDPGAIVVRRYALPPPTGWHEDCEAEMRRMTDLWNRLVEIERAQRRFRTRRRTIRTSHDCSPQLPSSMRR